ncbi:MAG: hypothetical protein AUI14_09590 [Actinobacteria bacterium 13_2_20CM_2_71_6]|nr:MAG: hypothetical protein AUI14_09590 [Actinobacteria bacterium 13_2_20CM_2_71_6]
MTDPDFIERGTRLDPDERDIEAPDADALEQSIPADPVLAALEQPPQVSRDPEVNDWDALEQAQVVDLDEDY